MTHEELRRLMPWHVNGTLAGEERQRVADHLAACPECRREVEELAALRMAERDLGEQMPVPSAARLDNVLERIDGLASAPAWYARIASWFFPLPTGARYVLAAQLVVIAVLIAIRGSNVPPYKTQTGGGATAQQLEIAVAFQPDVPESSIRALLLELDARIAGGPSAAGLYTVAFGVPSNDAARVDTILRALRARSAVVRFAERKAP